MNKKLLVGLIFSVLIICTALFSFACTEEGAEEETDFFFGGYYNRPTDTSDEASDETEDKSEGSSDEGSSDSTETGSEDSESGDEEDSQCTHTYAHICTDKCILCGEVREDASAHYYASESLCQDKACTRCGFILHQDHDWLLTDSGSATLLSYGTCISMCLKCDTTSAQNLNTPINPAALGMPVITITSLDGASLSMSNIDADSAAAIQYKYVNNSASISCYGMLNIAEGAHSQYQKRDLALTLYNDSNLIKENAIDIGFGSTSKYVLNATSIDITHLRDITASNIFAEILKDRGCLLSGISIGYPILLYIGNEFYGIYTINTPMNAMKFSMADDGSRNAILTADKLTTQTNLTEKLGELSNATGWQNYGFSLLHCSSPDSSWVKESFNELIALLNSTDKDEIITFLPSHLDIDAAIDYMLFTYFINAENNSAQNIVWTTYDGTMWIPRIGNLNASLGIDKNGQKLSLLNSFSPTINMEDKSFTIEGCKMYSVLINYFPEKVEQRYKYLRLEKNIFNSDKVETTFTDKISLIHPVAYKSECEKWYPNNPISIEQEKIYIVQSTQSHLARLDAFFLNFKSYIN